MLFSKLPEFRLSTVRNAAKLAVYVAIIMHDAIQHDIKIIRPDNAMGILSWPVCKNVETEFQMALPILSEVIVSSLASFHFLTWLILFNSSKLNLLFKSTIGTSFAARPYVSNGFSKPFK